jgi:FkbM family methyltransferase
MDKNRIKQMINKENPVIFEVGCADGEDTQKFMDVFQDVNLKMFCFEPEPTNIEIFKSRNLKNCNLFEGLVSDVDGEVEFKRSRVPGSPESLRYSGSLKNPKDHLKVWPQIVFDEKIITKSTTLDMFCLNNNIDIIDFVWADVQGAESEMINGGKNTFENKVRFLYTEYSNTEYYEGQKNLQEILLILGENWSVVEDFKTDVLLMNKKFV